MKCVDRTGEWYIAPTGARRSHIDRYKPVRQDLGFDKPRRGFDPKVGLARLPIEQLGDAASGIATSFRLTAVGIADVHQDLGRRMTRGLQQDQLVAADTGAPVCYDTHPSRTDWYGSAAKIEHDKVIAEPMHFKKRQPTHGAAYMAAAPTVSNGETARTGLACELLCLNPAVPRCRARPAVLGTRGLGRDRLSISGVAGPCSFRKARRMSRATGGSASMSGRRVQNAVTTVASRDPMARMRRISAWPIRGQRIDGGPVFLGSVGGTRGDWRSLVAEVARSVAGRIEVLRAGIRKIQRKCRQTRKSERTCDKSGR
jgi:hypothetical protein